MAFLIGKPYITFVQELDDHCLLIAYLIPVKCPKSKVLQGQKSSTVHIIIEADLFSSDFLLMSISVAPPKYPL